MSGRGRQPIYCAEHGSRRWQTYRQREGIPRTASQIRADLAAQIGAVLGRFDALIERDRLTDPLR